MPTRFYLPASGTSPLNSFAVGATWEGSASTFFRAPAPLVKTGTSLADFAARMGSTATRQDCWAQWTTQPLAQDFLFTNGHTISMVARGLEGDAACDAHLAYVVRVVSNDGSTDRGVIATFMAISTELLTTGITRIHAERAFTGGDLQAYAGDRIVIELGTHGVTPSVDFDVTWRFGDPTASGDFPQTSSVTTDVCPWVEISADVAFADGPVCAASAYPTAVSTSNATAPYDDHDWTNPEYISAPALIYYASITSTAFDTNLYSYILKGQHCDFAVPETATITGLEVRMLGAANLGTADWKIVQLINASGTAEGDNNYADGPATMFVTDTIHRFGSPTDLWGVALTPAMVNDDDFGVQFSIMATSDNTDIRVDYVKFIVYYTEAAGESAYIARSIGAGIGVGIGSGIG